MNRTKETICYGLLRAAKALDLLPNQSFDWQSLSLNSSNPEDRRKDYNYSKQMIATLFLSFFVSHLFTCVSSSDIVCQGTPLLHLLSLHNYYEYNA